MIEKGERFFKYLYGNQGTELNLNKCRYECHIQSSKNIKFDLRKMLPTSTAAKLHSLRLYLLVQV